MNIFKWIRCRAGKMALSAMQTVGLSAVVGVAGVAAWQYLGSPAETNNTFTPAVYNPGEVVYVAGANTGSYAGGSYAGGGESSSSVQISTNTFKRLEQQEMARQAEVEMAEYAPDYSAAAAAPTQAYQMGGTEGLGTGANMANELDLKNNPMAAMTQNMAGVTDMISRAQQQAQQQSQAAASGGEAQKGLPALASASKNWGSSSATGGSSGNSFNSSFSVQDSGKNAGKNISSVDALAQAGDVMASARAQAAGMMEGARIRGRASFGSDGLGESRNASVRKGRSTKEANDLEFIRRRSADAAKNRNRSAVEGARAFLASTKVSGGMIISTDNVTTGQGQGSKDFESDYDTNLRGIKSWGAGIDSDAMKRDQDRSNLKTWLWSSILTAIGAMLAIPSLKHIKIFGVPLVALIVAAAATAILLVALAKAIKFAKTWGGEGITTAVYIVTPLLIGGVWASFFWSSAFKSAYKAVGKFLGFGAAAA
ncbi:MAG: hypothetical protein ACI351_00160 [Candidatus Avelusimicrobium sp.]|uniref:hypothetical protein n=1 Tax=Candidatus Avelusimicrobium sp. TaxID=3048833 RepID=UPI003F076CDA